MSNNPRHIIQRYYTPPTPLGAASAAVWSVKEQLQAQGSGNWPYASNFLIAAVGGGGGGSKNNYPGSGGPGGYFTTTQSLNSIPIAVFQTTYVVTIGAGGTGATTSNTNGGNGTISTVIGGVISLSAVGGVTSGVFLTQTGPYSGTNGAAGPGAGGNGTTVGGPGTSALSPVTSEIAALSGTVYGELSGGLYYYGGGGGNPLYPPGVGYGATFNASPTNARSNSGGGGHGGGNTTFDYNASNGGSGVVIIKSPVLAQSISASYSLTAYGNRYYYYTITSSGSITF